MCTEVVIPLSELETSGLEGYSLVPVKNTNKQTKNKNKKHHHQTVQARKLSLNSYL